MAIDNGTTASYLYNANNMRVMKTVNQPDPLSPQVVRYGWDNDRIFAEYDQNGNPIQETVYFGSTPVALLKDGNVYRIYADQIDTPRVITDSSNTVLWAWDSKPFGESAPDEDVDKDGSALSYNLRFPGQYFDVETGKHYNFNRDYDPVTGRYIQSDPIGLDGGDNAYVYVLNNSLLFTDNNGLRTVNIRVTNPYYTPSSSLDYALNRMSSLVCSSSISRTNSIRNKIEIYKNTNYDVETWYYLIYYKINRGYSTCNYAHTLQLSYEVPLDPPIIPYTDWPWGRGLPLAGYIMGSFNGRLKFTW